MLWVDKYRPKSLDQLDYHASLSHRLKMIAGMADIPHLLFYGPSGAGKKTRVMALLREVFGPGVEKVKLDTRTFKTPTKRSIEVTTLASSYHIEMNPSDAGNNDRFIVQEVIKEIAQYHPVISQQENANPLMAASSSSSSSSSGNNNKGKGSYKVVFLSDCDSLTKGAQHALRRTMEKYVQSCRLILCCENLSKVIGPLRSRCLAIRVPAPQEEEICGILTNVSRKEGATNDLPPPVVSSIAKASKRNLRRALLMAEAQKVSKQTDGKVHLPDWEIYIHQLAKLITSRQDPDTLLKAREMLYNLLGNCIPASLIFQTLTANLLGLLDDPLKHNITQWAAHYEHRLQMGDKDIYHIEAFIAKFMLLYKDYIISSFF